MESDNILSHPDRFHPDKIQGQQLPAAEVFYDPLDYSMICCVYVNSLVSIMENFGCAQWCRAYNFSLNFQCHFSFNFTCYSIDTCYSSIDHKMTSIPSKILAI